MANVKISANADMRNPILVPGFVIQSDATSFVVNASTSQDIRYITYRGTFTYDAANQIDGTLTSYGVTINGTPTLSITGPRLPMDDK